ncbi:MAG: roadblock/LC7 domain-containing protein [Euryarchaeota archaeon]|nr:roadblock/LC7 domain-containing protein [Euryarchaeota archaeon]
MTETKGEALRNALKKVTAVHGVVGAAIVARNGLLIASELPKDVDERRLGAMTATMMGAVETAGMTLNKGSVRRVIAEVEHSTIVATGAGQKAIMVCTADNGVNLGMLMLEMEDQSAQVRAILEG